MKYYFLTAAFLIFGANLNAQLNYPPSFVPHGPGGGGYMYSPSINPANPSQIYLTCDMGGVYRSNSNGEAWQLLPQIVSTVKGKVQFTSDPNIQYMVRRSTTNLNDPLQRGEIAKTTDGGSTWSPVNDPTATGVHRLEADPNSTQRILVSEYNQLFFTNDGGASWSVAYHPSDDQLWMGGVFWDGNQIYVGTNKGLLVSHNGGQTFSIETHAGMPAEEGIFHLSGAKQGGVTRLFVVTALQQEMYAWLEVLDLRQYIQQVYRMDYQQGATWQNTRGNIENGVFLNWIDLAQNDVEKIWAAGDVNGLPMIFRSLDGGQTWSNLFFASDNENVLTGWGGDYGAFSYLWSGAALGFDVNDSDPDHVIFTDGMGHITNSSGSEWRAIYVNPASLNPVNTPTSATKVYQSSGLDVTTAHQLFWLNDQQMFSANTDIGSTYSADGGNTWTFGRSTYYPWGTVANPNWYRIVQRPDNQVLYAVLSEVNDIYLGYRIADWQIDGGGILVRSTDQGATWDTLYNFGHPVVWLEIDKNNPNRMFASVVHPTEGGLYRSDNAGVTWLEMAKPARAEGHPYNLVSLSDGGVVASFSARGVGSGDSLSESSGVFYSPSAGGAWIDRSGPAMRWYTKDLVLDPHDPSEQTWYATVWGRFTVWPGPNNAGNGGLYRTTDRGLNWTRIYAHETAESITIHPGNPNIAYLTVENDGLYYTENLTDPQPVFSRVTSFPFWRPKRVFFKPGHWSDVWVTTMGGGLWEGRTLSGTAAPEETLNLKVWPNPIAAGGMLHVEIRENQTLWLGLRDVSGKLIKTADLHTPGQFSLEGIAPGVYWLEWRMGGVYVGGEKVLVR